MPTGIPYPETLTMVLLGQGTLLAAILLVMESRQRLANVFLAALLMVFALRLLALLLGSGPHLGPWRTPALLLHNVMFLLGPLVLYYARTLVRTVPPLEMRDAVHALPFVLACLWSWLAGELYARPLDDPALLRLTAVHGLFSNASIIAYSLATLSLLRRYRARLLDHYATIERLSLDWLRNVAGVILALGVAVAVVNLLRLLSGWAVDPNRLIGAPVSVLVFYGVAIMGFRQSQVLLGTRPLQEQEPEPGPPDTVVVAAVSRGAAPAQAAVEEPVSADAPEQPGGVATSARYQRSGLNEYRAGRLWQRLQELMRRERLHLQPDLHLGILAERLGVRQQTLSEVLNEHAGLRFYDFVNGLRVEEAKRLLADPAHARLSVLDIALMAGFSSKSTFNKYFALSVGRTPSTFRRAQRPA